MYKSTRELDHAMEQEVHKFMLEYFYFHRNDIKSAKSVDDKNQQLSGSDIIISAPKYNLENVIIDEKAAIHHVTNNHLHTFAFELFSFQKNLAGEYSVERKGWFLKEDSSTDYYLLMWPRVDSKKVKWESIGGDTYPSFKKEDIESLHYCLVKKETIKMFVKDKHFDDDWLKITARKIRKECPFDSKEKGFKKWYAYRGEGFNFYYSFRLPERPVNLLIEREDLDRLAVLHDTIYPYSR